MHPQYHESVEKIKGWSQQAPNIHAVILLGSQVRKEFTGDEWSDLDVLLLADDPQVLLRSDAWLAFLGERVCGVMEETPLDWLPLTWSVKRVLFADNRTIDFSILPYARLDDVLAMNAEIHAHGYQVLYDAHDGLVSSKIETTLATVQDEPARMPTADELHQVVSELLFQLMYASKKVKRNELWVAVSAINQGISSRLLQLIEYHIACSGRVPDRIRYEGRFLEQRAHLDTLAKLQGCIARYDVADAIHTISNILELAEQLSREICAIQKYPFDAHPFDGAQLLYGAMFGKS
jgi:aminoglycoside 6-adenylyltransferase